VARLAEVLESGGHPRPTAIGYAVCVLRETAAGKTDAAGSVRDWAREQVAAMIGAKAAMSGRLRAAVERAERSKNPLTEAERDTLATVLQEAYETPPPTTAGDALKSRGGGSATTAGDFNSKHPRAVGGKFATKPAAATPTTAKKSQASRIAHARKIEQVQALLDKLGYDLGDGGRNGVMTPATRSALAAFQKKMGLPPNGKITPATLSLLNREKSSLKAKPKRGEVTLSADQPSSVSEAYTEGLHPRDRVGRWAMKPAAFKLPKGWRFLGEVYSANELGNAGPLRKGSEYLAAVYRDVDGKLRMVRVEQGQVTHEAEGDEIKGSDFRRVADQQVSAARSVKTYTLREASVVGNPPVPNSPSSQTGGDGSQTAWGGAVVPMIALGWLGNPDGGGYHLGGEDLVQVLERLLETAVAERKAASGGAEFTEAWTRERLIRERLARLQEVKSSAYPGLDRSPKENWVDKAGGLPSYIERIAKHLHYEKGKEIGNAIAIAVNVVKKMCASGDTNFPGKQNVNAKSRAEACAAVASWEKKKGGGSLKEAEALIEAAWAETDREKRPFYPSFEQAFEIAARAEEFHLREALPGFTKWDPRLHPRNRLGEFTDVIGKLVRGSGLTRFDTKGTGMTVRATPISGAYRVRGRGVSKTFDTEQEVHDFLGARRRGMAGGYPNKLNEDILYEFFLDQWGQPDLAAERLMDLDAEEIDRLASSPAVQDWMERVAARSPRRSSGMSSGETVVLDKLKQGDKVGIRSGAPGRGGMLPGTFQRREGEVAIVRDWRGRDQRIHPGNIEVLPRMRTSRQRIPGVGRAKVRGGGVVPVGGTPNPANDEFNLANEHWLAQRTAARFPSDENKQRVKVLASKLAAMRKQADADYVDAYRAMGGLSSGTAVEAPPFNAADLKDVPLYELASMIRRDWSQQGKGVNFAAKPYLDAMMGLQSHNDMYGADSGRTILAYFLGNAGSYKGPQAKLIKAELKRRLREAGETEVLDKLARLEEATAQREAATGSDLAVALAVEQTLREAVLTAAKRKSLGKGEFAIPETRSYPIHDEAHARNALARVAQFGTDEEKRRVRAAVKRRYPNIGDD
jgi:peptidoglycan hydrolase-like protein with peptidoglycan-binding domain